MPVHEDQVKSIIEETIRQLGPAANDDLVKKIVFETIKRIDQQTGIVEKHHSTFKYLNRTEGRIIVTAFGKNQPGVLSSITKTLSDCNCDIQDLSQKIMQEFFTLIMVVDIKNAICPFGILKDNLTKVADKLGIRVLAQHEDIFKAMHRV